MAKWYLAALLPLVLAACGGGGGGDSFSGGGGSSGGGGTGSGDPALGFFTGNDINAVAGNGDVGTVFVGIDLESNFSRGELTTNTNGNVQTINVSRRSGTNTYLNSNGTVGFTIFDKLNGGPAADQTAFVEGFDRRTGTPVFFAFASTTNRGTPLAGGTAVYDGVVVARNAQGNRFSGDIRLTANFDGTDRINGRIIGGFPNRPTAVFRLVEGSINSNGRFVTTLTSNDVNIQNSRLEGRGSGGNRYDQLSGSYTIDAGAAGSVVGLFDAER